MIKVRQSVYHKIQQYQEAVGLFVRRAIFLLSIPLLTSGCSGGPDLDKMHPSMLPIPAEASYTMEQMSMTKGAPIFVRIFKEESEFEIWKKRADGYYYHFKTYPICNWSGKVGPKQRNGDRQAPEGFYTIWNGLMNPKSRYHLAFNLGYPNKLDRAYGRTGKHLMVHGDCSSSGCYAMTDALVEEIYAIAREAFNGGQKGFQVHAFPFRMTKENMKRHRKQRWNHFWRNLKQGYDLFLRTRKPPTVDACSRRYIFNAHFYNGRPKNAAAPCPRYKKIKVADFPQSPLNVAAIQATSGSLTGP